VAALLSRLSPFFWNDTTNNRLPLRRITGSANYHANFPGIVEVFSLLVHETDGWPSRNQVEPLWVTPYSAGHTIGPQLAVFGDGTLMQLVNLPDKTGHASFVNGWALGVETGHRNSRAGASTATWLPLSTNTNDVVGQKLFALHQVAENPHEVVAAWFPTATYWGPKRDAAVPTGMLFNEAQYRTWGRLARYLCEAFMIPRNFPLLPHALRSATITDHATFRRIILADESFDAIKALLKTKVSFVDTDFVAGHETDFKNRYQATQATVVAANSTISDWGMQHDAMMPGSTTPMLQARNVQLNQAWLWMFKAYRGLHGHGYSGNIIQGFTWQTQPGVYKSETYFDHDCPGAMWDWHRFAREVWDWWWYPFDFDSTHARTDVDVRPYRTASGTTELREYFFYENLANYTARATTGIQGAGSSPNTFRLEDNSPIYALANGELVAARYVRTKGVVDMGFVLVRHEVFHQPDTTAAQAVFLQLFGATAPPNPPPAGRIDYDQEPTWVYSLYMHLPGPDGLNFDDISQANPDWLNRVIIRRKEADLAYPPPAKTLAGTLAGIPTADFTTPPASVGYTRPNPLQAWQNDQSVLGSFLDALKAGNTAVAPSRIMAEAIGVTWVNVLLGDYLGRAGVIGRDASNNPIKGVRVEVFSPTLPSSTDFTEIRNQTSWNVVGNPQRPALLYQSEWARKPSSADAAALTAAGVDPDFVTWWPAIVLLQAVDILTPGAARLPLDGKVYHYWPAVFMDWVNKLTWKSEWPKYKITLPAGTAPPDTPQRSRWI
jgi:hypothetical protein